MFIYSFTQSLVLELHFESYMTDALYITGRFSAQIWKIFLIYWYINRFIILRHFNKTPISKHQFGFVFLYFPYVVHRPTVYGPTKSARHKRYYRNEKYTTHLEF